MSGVTSGSAPDFNHPPGREPGPPELSPCVVDEQILRERRPADFDRYQ